MTRTEEIPLPAVSLRVLIEEGNWNLFLTECEKDDVKELVLNERNFKLWTLLHSAVALGAPIEVIEKLLDLGIDVNSRETPISRLPYRGGYSATGGFFGSVFSVSGIPVEQHARLIDAASHPFEQQGIYATPLVVAILYKARFDVIKLLIERGADVTLKNLGGDTPILLACDSYRNVELIELLLGKGADAKDLTFNGLTTLHQLLFESTEDVQEDEKEDTQVDGDADNINPAVKGKEGPTLATKTIERHTKIAKMLIDHGADVNSVDDQGWSVLCFACDDTRDYLDMVKLLLDAGADIYNGNINTLKYFLQARGLDKKVKHGKVQTPLIIGAACSEDLSMVKFLVDQGASVDESDDGMWTALLTICTMAEYSDELLEVAEYLIQQGANVNVRGDSGATPLLDIIGKHGKIEQRRREKPEAREKRMENDLILFNMLLDNGADINVIHSDRNTSLLCCACQYEHAFLNEKIMDVILEKVNPELINRPNDAGLTPLESALLVARDIDLLKKLLARGAQITPEITDKLNKVRAKAPFAGMADYLQSIGLFTPMDPPQIHEQKSLADATEATPEPKPDPEAVLEEVPRQEPEAVVEVAKENPVAAEEESKREPATTVGEPKKDTEDSPPVVEKTEEPKTSAIVSVVGTAPSLQRSGPLNSFLRGIRRAFFGNRNSRRTNLGGQ